MDGPPLERGAGRPALAAGRQRILREELPRLDGDVPGHHHPEELPVEAEDRRVRLAQPHHVLGEGLEHGLQIGGRPADHLQELAGRRPLLEGDAELAAPRAKLGGQARVLGAERLEPCSLGPLPLKGFLERLEPSGEVGLGGRGHRPCL